MSHRTQVTLTDRQYERLRREAARSGLGLAELVRRAIDDSYGSTAPERVVDGLEASFGGWGDLDGNGAEYVEGRRRGLGKRLADA